MSHPFDLLLEKLQDDPTYFDPPEMFIHPTLADAGITEDDFPLTNPAHIKARAEIENFPIPYCTGNRERRYQWWTPDGQPAFFPAAMIPPGAMLTGRNGYEYISVGGFYFIVSDSGAWHGERLRDDEARDAANDAWAAKIGS